MVEGGGLENRCTRKGTVGSNPTSSAKTRLDSTPPRRSQFALENPVFCAAQGREAMMFLDSSSLKARRVFDLYVAQRPERE